MSEEQLPTIVAEMSALEAQMGDRGSEYWRSPEKQERYRQLIERRQNLASQAGPTILSEDPLKVPSAAEFYAAAPEGDYGAFTSVMRHISDIAFWLPSGELPALVRSFESLPDTITSAMVDELLQYRPQVEPCSAEGVAEFAKLPVGAVLVREWGSEAGRNLAIVRERLFRVVDELKDEDVDRFCDWIEGLSEGAAVAIYRKLAS